MFLLLIGPVFELVYLSSDIEKKVTLSCTITILVLLTHMILFYLKRKITSEFTEMLKQW